MMLKIYLLNFKEVPLDILLNSPYISLLEKSSFSKYKNEAVKKEKIASAILKNKYIGSYHLNEFGKPVSDVTHFNISHSEGYIALVIDTVPVGIDIEKIRFVEDELKEYISNKDEQEYIHNDKTFFEVWTNKESLVKARGSGLTNKLDTIPGLPINGTRNYQGQTYRSRTLIEDGLIITVTRISEEEFSFDIIKEVI